MTRRSVPQLDHKPPERALFGRQFLAFDSRFSCSSPLVREHVQFVFMAGHGHERLGISSVGMKDPEVFGCCALAIPLKKLFMTPGSGCAPDDVKSVVRINHIAHPV